MRVMRVGFSDHAFASSESKIGDGEHLVFTLNVIPTNISFFFLFLFQSTSLTALDFVPSHVVIVRIVEESHGREVRGIGMYQGHQT